MAILRFSSPALAMILFLVILTSLLLDWSCSFMLLSSSSLDEMDFCLLSSVSVGSVVACWLKTSCEQCRCALWSSLAKLLYSCSYFLSMMVAILTLKSISSYSGSESEPESY